MNRPTTPSQANSNIITNNINNQQNNSMRLLAGSHLATNGQTVTQSVAASAVNTLNGHGSSSTSSASSTTSNSTLNNNLAFFQANPHLLNSAALHSTLFTQPAVNCMTQSTNMVVFKEPLNVQQSSDKKANEKRLLFEPASHNKDIFLQVILKSFLNFLFFVQFVLFVLILAGNC